MGWVLPILGSLGFIFRYWVVNIKLAEELGSNRGHISRLLIYFFFFSMILEFESNVFTLLMLISAPGMIVVFIQHDIPYYRQFRTMVAPEHKKGWLLIERILLHPPIYIFAIIFYSTGTERFFYSLFTVPTFIAGILIVFIPFFLSDPRWKDKSIRKQGYQIIVGAILSIIGIFIYYYILVHYWSNGFV